MELNLNGEWYFAIDQDPEYHRGEDYSRETSLRHWERVPVPECWNRYAERYDLFEGVAWFVREFEVAALPPEPVAPLRFGAVNYRAEVYLNGQRVGEHEGGYTAFALDISDGLREGRNRLAVRVDNRHLRMRLPAVLGWYNYGGIHRGVSLRITAGAQIESVRVTLAPDGEGGRGEVKVQKAGGAALPLNVTARLYDPTGARVWEAQAAGPGPWVLPVKLDRAVTWSPERPALYRCEVELSRGEEVLDTWEGTCGVRSLDIHGQELRLNGEPLYLRGICYLYDHPATGVTFSPEVVARDLDDLQEIGVNCLRSHFPVDDLFLEECDRRGMMLWLEVPIYCVAPAESCGSAFAEASVQGLALQMLREMIAQSHNHPSVILWGVGNECDTDHPEAAAFFRACVEQVRTEDPTRLIGYAALYGGVGCAADLVDVIGINEYWGWYDRLGWGAAETPAPRLPLELPELEACLAEQSALGKPLLLTEFGADAEPGFRSESSALWSEEYQALFLARQLEILARFPAVCGTFPFSYADYRDPSKPIGPYWHGINLKGVVSYDRQRKLGWETLRQAYRGIAGKQVNM